VPVFSSKYRGSDGIPPGQFNLVASAPYLFAHAYINSCSCKKCALRIGSILVGSLPIVIQWILVMQRIILKSVKICRYIL